jgi:hypothetical protein
VSFAVIPRGVHALFGSEIQLRIWCCAEGIALWYLCREEDPLGKPLCLPIVAVACGWDHPGPGTSRDNVKEEEKKRRAR